MFVLFHSIVVSGWPPTPFLLSVHHPLSLSHFPLYPSLSLCFSSTFLSPFFCPSISLSLSLSRTSHTSSFFLALSVLLVNLSLPSAFLKSCSLPLPHFTFYGHHLHHTILFWTFIYAFKTYLSFNSRLTCIYYTHECFTTGYILFLCIFMILLSVLFIM